VRIFWASDRTVVATLGTMLIPIALIVLVLIAALVGAAYVAKKRVIDHEGPRGNARPEDRVPQARP
jgi:hypothetical protein